MKYFFPENQSTPSLICSSHWEIPNRLTPSIVFWKIYHQRNIHNSYGFGQENTCNAGSCTSIQSSSPTVFCCSKRTEFRCWHSILHFHLMNQSPVYKQVLSSDIEPNKRSKKHGGGILWFFICFEVQYIRFGDWNCHSGELSLDKLRQNHFLSWQHATKNTFIHIIFCNINWHHRRCIPV